MVKSYEDLIVWQKSVVFAEEVYRLQRTLPKEERFGVGDQLRRAAISVPSNIAEGFGRESSKDFMHFLTVARGSLYETRTQLRIAVDLGLLKDISSVDILAVEVGRLLNAFISRLRSSHQNHPANN